MRRAGDPAQVAAVLDTLGRLLDSGTRADVGRLARLAVDRLIDASHGSAGGVADEALLERALALYARACAAYPPDPLELADWVLAVSFGDPAVDVPLKDYAGALGDAGIERIRSTVDAKLVRSDPDGAGADAGEAAGDGAEPAPDDADRDRAERLAEQIAEITGDVDRLVAAWSQRLPNVDVSLRIVRVLRAAGRHTEAIAHAARARGTDPSRIAELLAAGRDDDAWALTKQLPAESLGEAIEVYRGHVEELIERRDTRNPSASYARAAVGLRRLRSLHRDAGTREEFADYLAGIVSAHRRKTRLLDEIRRARIALPTSKGAAPKGTAPQRTAPKGSSAQGRPAKGSSAQGRSSRR